MPLSCIKPNVGKPEISVSKTGQCPQAEDRAVPVTRRVAGQNVVNQGVPGSYATKCPKKTNRFEDLVIPA
ncbi:MAG: hypothetical protein CMM01_10845 [Rhodopirellula sp.]|nr:hypothetical protein [Rhodopirellula sp.]